MKKIKLFGDSDATPIEKKLRLANPTDNLITIKFEYTNTSDKTTSFSEHLDLHKCTDYLDDIQDTHIMVKDFKFKIFGSLESSSTYMKSNYVRRMSIDDVTHLVKPVQLNVLIKYLKETYNL